MKYKIVYLVLIVFITSCTTWKKELKQDGNEKDARMNIINDFYHKHSKKNAAYFITNNYIELENLYLFVLKKKYPPSPLRTDTIGGYTYSFPTQYLEKKERLFYWQDKEKVLTRNIIDKLTAYIKIDSSWYKKPYDEGPIVSNGRRERYIYYFVCKNNISKYKKKKAIWINKEEYPDVKCRKN